MSTTPTPRIHMLETADLAPEVVAAVQALLTAAFERDEHGGFTWDDWLHAIGGTHFVLELDGVVVGHASVVERPLEISERPVRTGYVEAVAILPSLQRQGLGTFLMRAVTMFVAGGYELWALGTGSQAFYERLGWQIWHGPTGVRVDAGFQPTPEEDGYILVLRTPASPPFDLTEPI
ncbi:MAG: GNAT family N-acetyltransferase [Chloroflexota bacterium]